MILTEPILASYCNFRKTSLKNNSKKKPKSKDNLKFLHAKKKKNQKHDCIKNVSDFRIFFFKNKIARTKINLLFKTSLNGTLLKYKVENESQLSD